MLRTFDPVAAQDDGFPTATVLEIPAYLRRIRSQESTVAWIDVGAAGAGDLEELGGLLGWHPLLIEDLVEGEQRQKAERFEEDLLIVVRPPGEVGDVALVLRGELGVTVRRDWDLLSATVRQVRLWPEPDEAGATAIACALLDQLVREYERYVDGIEHRALDQEARVLDGVRGRDPLPALQRAAALRTDVAVTRRRSAQLREVVGALVREDLLERRHGAAVSLDLRDIYDHVLRVHDDLDVLNDRLIALQESRLQLVAYRQNEITKRISGWGALLLIPTIVTGWYGMNFPDLWFLQTDYGQYIAFGFAATMMLLIGYLLRRAEWL